MQHRSFTSIAKAGLFKDALAVLPLVVFTRVGGVLFFASHVMACAADAIGAAESVALVDAAEA